jgi:cytochrome c556
MSRYEILPPVSRGTAKVVLSVVAKRSSTFSSMSTASYPMIGSRWIKVRRTRHTAEAQAARSDAEKQVTGATQEKAIWEQLAAEAEAAKTKLAQEVAGLQAAARRIEDVATLADSAERAPRIYTSAVVV